MGDKPFNTREFLEVRMNHKLKDKPDSVRDFFCVFQFEIGDQIWNLDLTSSKEKMIKLGTHSDPDCTIRMTDENFEKLLKRKLNVPMALITGKIKISGDKALALKLGELFS